MMIRIYPVALFVAMLSACAPVTKHATFTEAQIKQETLYQQRLAIDHELEQRQRLVNVLYRLGQAGAPECGGNKRLSGMELGGIGLFEKAYHPAAQEIGFSSGVRVMSVASGSPADQAGIKVGDTLATINGDRVRESKTAYRLASRDLAEAMQAGEVKLSLVRAGTSYNTSLTAIPGCPAPFHITREVMPAPKANGEAVLIPYSLMRLSRTDDEVATLAAFALAFNVRDLLGAAGEDAMTASRNRNISALIGGDESTLFYLQRGIATQRELSQADEYAIKLMRRAGYDPRGAVTYWRRLLASTPELENDKSWGKYLLGNSRLVDMKLLAMDSP